MSHQDNSKEFAEVGQGKAVNDVTDKYDSLYGKYKHTAKPLVESKLPAEPSPFKALK